MLPLTVIELAIAVMIGDGCCAFVSLSLGKGEPGKAVESTALSMIREIVFGVDFAVVLPIFFGLDGVLYSMPVSDILTFAVALFLIIRTYRELTAAHKDSHRNGVPVGY